MRTILGCTITKELYKGSNSLVYRGHWQADNQPIILKILNQVYPSPEKIARFQLEYEIIQDLNPPASSAGQAVLGVVEAYSLETDQNQWAMVLEDFGGQSLDRIIQDQHLSLTEFLTYAVQVADILDRVHQRHIIHKDINPSNLVLNPATGQLKVIDFGISTRLFRESPTLRNPNVMEGTLAYISPEQTGRMNREIDYRTDFYSLGVTFYELLTGQLPFPIGDALALVHAHIAVLPAPPHELKPDIPRPLSDIVMKLMAKNAEDRYQSAFSLKADLEECLLQWQSKGRIDPFPPRQREVSSQFQIPQKLYGREQEIDLLLTAFDRVSQGASEMMLVAGYTGIGKSALVQEVYKPITRQRGYFITGKFDQFQRDIPYASLLQAFRSLGRQLLTETKSEIAVWREKLQEALGPNGRVIIEVIPEVELIIGPQPDVPDLPPVEAQNRFNLVFQNFIKVFTKPEHPLVLFLDDLQWADGASLKLVNVLMTAGESEHLFLIGAYRDNEVNETHPLILTLNEMRQAGVVINEIALKPLILANISQLLADTFKCASPDPVRPLAELVMPKTEGNPFFVKEFLKSLYAEELITFDFERGAWQWDLDQIQTQGITDNVVELMAGKVRKLGQHTQQVLKLAACIGNQFDLQTLSIVYERSPRETAAALWESLTEGLVLPLDDSYKLMGLDIQGLAEGVMVEYKFAHDQIQQAAYSLIPEAERQAVHWQVGQLLRQNTPAQELEQKIFDIVNQLNLGRALINQQPDRDELAKLNLRAGQKAKASAAYQPAANYLTIGLDLISDSLRGENGETDSWDTQYDLVLALHLEAAEAAYLNSDFGQTERLVALVLQRAKVLLDKVRVYEVRIQAYIAQHRLLEAVKTARSVLELLGTRFPKKPNKGHILLSFVGTKLALTGKRIEGLSNLPITTDPMQLAERRILKTSTAVTYLAAPDLFPLTVFKLVNLSVKQGNTAESAFIYALYGISLGGVAGDIDSGYRFGQLALNLMDQFDARELRAKILFAFYFFIKPWKAHIKESLEPFMEAYQDALDIGDVEYASYLLYAPTCFSYHLGKELTKLSQEIGVAAEAIDKLKQERSVQLHSIRGQAVLNLLGQSDSPHRLVGEICDEEQLEQLYLETNDRNGLGELYLNQLILNYLFEKYPEAAEDAARVETYLDALVGTIYPAIFRFYDSLTQLALFPEASKSVQKRIIRKVKSNQKKIRKWAQHAPMNYLHKVYLIEAEYARVVGKDDKARECYDQAIALAQENQYVNEVALAYELAAKFYWAKEQSQLARYYIRDAHYTYLRWGALAKVEDLERQYPQLLAQAVPGSLQSSLTISTTDTGQRTSSALDLNSVLKASQAISGEIVLEKLLTRLMKVVIENAGAQKGFLLLQTKGNWIIKAEGVIEQRETENEGEAEVRALQSTPTKESEQLSRAVINYVARTKENVVLINAAEEGIFTQDPYIIQNRPKSVLCAPLINQGKLTGMLYLENNLIAGAFTPDRLEVLNLLSTQAAISIENASLYTHQVELNNAASRFVPFEFLRFLKKESLVEVKLGDHVQQEMAVLFSDIRSFTSLSETMTPQENFDFVNAYFGRISPIIRQHKGIIVKYLGDGMMAVFPERVEDALSASIEKVKAVARFNDNRQQEGEPPIRIGVGIHTGKMMLGTVGEAQRMQGDFLSDVVNLTNRLEGLTKTYGVSIVISQEALNRLEDPTQYHFRFLGKVQVKGRQEPVSVFEVFDGEPEEAIKVRLQTQADFEQGLICHYDRRFDEARNHLEQVLEQNPEDEAARRYLRRTIHFLEQGVPDDWAGFEALTEK